MPDQPPDLGPHSTAAIGNRLRTGHGREIAKLVWWAILALPRDGTTWRSNLDLGDDVGLPWANPEQQAQRAVKLLRESGMVATSMGRRPDAPRKYGRILRPDTTTRVIVPAREHMTNLWETCHLARQRPAALVTLMTGMHILAAHESGARPNDWAAVPGSISELRRFVGACQGSTFSRRLDALEGLGMVRRRSGVAVAPVEAWAVGMRRAARR